MEPRDFDAAEEVLLEADFADCRPVWYSSNYVYLVVLRHPSEGDVLGIYKPHRGEAPLWDFPDGALYRREVAAYRFARAAGWGFVPPTVVREGPHGIGAVQLFIAHDPHLHYFEQRERPELTEQLQRIVLFDAITNNADRKAGHLLLDEAGRVWGIDHGLCFHVQHKLRTVMWDWAGEPIPPALMAELAAVVAGLALGAGAFEPVRLLLRPEEYEATLRRAKALLEQGRFPLPGPHRSYPWPLV